MFTTLTRVKLVLVIIAIAVFGYGVREDISWLRWVSIGLLGSAFLLRFIGRSRA